MMNGINSFPAVQARVPEQMLVSAVLADLSRFVFYCSLKVSNS